MSWSQPSSSENNYYERREIRSDMGGDIVSNAGTLPKDIVGRQLHDTKLAPSKHVRWTACTIDNEHLGRRSSKAICVYPKPKAFDESSDEEVEEEEEEKEAKHDDDNGCSCAEIQRYGDAMSFKRQRQGYATYTNDANVAMRNTNRTALCA